MKITTTLVSLGDWHLRIHRIESGRSLKAAEGGFPLSRCHDLDEAPPMPEVPAGSTEALAAFPWGASRIAACEPGTLRTGALANLSPNLNLLYPQVVVPLLKGRLEPGLTIWAAAVRAGDRESVINAPLPLVELGTRLGIGEWGTGTRVLG